MQGHQRCRKDALLSPPPCCVPPQLPFSLEALLSICSSSTFRAGLGWFSTVPYPWNTKCSPGFLLDAWEGFFPPAPEEPSAQRLHQPRTSYQSSAGHLTTFRREDQQETKDTPPRKGQGPRIAWVQCNALSPTPTAIFWAHCKQTLFLRTPFISQGSGSFCCNFSKQISPLGRHLAWKISAQTLKKFWQSYKESNAGARWSWAIFTSGTAAGSACNAATQRKQRPKQKI